MLVVETIARIRREYFVKGKPIKVYRTRFLGHKFVSCGGPE